LTPWVELQCVQLSGGPVEYHDVGDGPPVVLLHGVVMNHTQWDQVVPLLPKGFRYIRPVLPLGGHRLPSHPDADLSIDGLTALVAEFLEALGLEQVTLVISDWGGGLLLRARGLDARVHQLVIFPCEAFDNFPPGLPGRVAGIAGRMPGGVFLAAHQLRIGWVRRSPLLLGQMVKRPIAKDLVASWTHGLVTNAGVRRDLRRYLRSPLDRDRLRRDTELLNTFTGSALVAWCPENRVMPVRHGDLLATLIRRSEHVTIPDAYALPMLDAPDATAVALATFLCSGDEQEQDGEPVRQDPR
jgi:pimeloyl-ACP methyl ester carboxylesterase